MVHAVHTPVQIYTFTHRATLTVTRDREGGARTGTGRRLQPSTLNCMEVCVQRCVWCAVFAGSMAVSQPTDNSFTHDSHPMRSHHRRVGVPGEHPSVCKRSFRGWRVIRILIVTFKSSDRDAQTMFPPPCTQNAPQRCISRNVEWLKELRTFLRSEARVASRASTTVAQEAAPRSALRF